MSHEQTIRVLLGIRNPRIREQVLLSFQRESTTWVLEDCRCEGDAARELICGEFDLVIIDYSSLGIKVWGLVGLICDRDFPVLIATNESTELEMSGDPYDCPTVALIVDTDSELARIVERAKSLLPSRREVHS
ncbi:hypothetical protein BVY04_01865 [bacterium M21]|nr:hypothetical protein BVY04_01865 [bacterium M21]